MAYDDVVHDMQHGQPSDWIATVIILGCVGAPFFLVGFLLGWWLT